MTTRRGMGGRTGLGLLIGMGLAILLVVIAGQVTRDAGPVATTAALADDTVVAVLGTGGEAMSDALRTALHAARAAPKDRTAVIGAARLAISEGRMTGDSRRVGAALGLLRPFLDNPDAEVLTLAATARQYQHDFPGALDLLDRAIDADPRNAQALLTRATIRTVLGEFGSAEQDCRSLHALPRPDLGLLCQSAARVLSAEAPAVYARLEAILARPGLLDPALHGYARGLMGEIAALQGWSDRARVHFEAALADAPDDHRTRALLVDLLLAEGAADEALSLLEDAPDTDALLIRRAQAARAAGETQIARVAEEELARRVQQNADLDLDAHAREEAQYYLDIAPDATRALDRARVNWALQHEIDDTRLLIDAALAAGDPAAAAPVLDWIAAENVEVPTLDIPDAVREAAR